jgi:hypothetical protein
VDPLPVDEPDDSQTPLEAAKKDPRRGLEGGPKVTAMKKLLKQGLKCDLCQDPSVPASQVEHLIAVVLARMAVDVGGFTVPEARAILQDALAPACVRCNLEKGGRTVGVTADPKDRFIYQPRNPTSAITDFMKRIGTAPP